MHPLAVVLAVIVLSSVEAKPSRDDPEPAFCNGLECPHFKIVNKTDKYELRCYQNDYKWVSTIVAGRIVNKLVPFIRIGYLFIGPIY